MLGVAHSRCPSTTFLLPWTPPPASRSHCWEFAANKSRFCSIAPPRAAAAPSEAAAELLGALITAEKESRLDLFSSRGRNPAAPALRGVDLGPVPRLPAVSLRRAWRRGPGGLFSGERERSIGPSTAAAEAAGLAFGRCDLTGRGERSVLRRPGPDVEPFLAGTFRSVVASQESRRCGTTETRSRLSRHDLHHGHFFRADLTIPRSGIALGLVGALFHCSEYPAADACVLRGIGLGYCQEGSDCFPSMEDWRYRNALWSAWWSRPSEEEDEDHDQDSNLKSMDRSLAPLQQAVWLLDGKAPEVAKLRVDGSEFGPDCPNTVWEGHFGSHIADIFHLGGEGVWCAHVNSH